MNKVTVDNVKQISNLKPGDFVQIEGYVYLFARVGCASSNQVVAVDEYAFIALDNGTVWINASNMKSQIESVDGYNAVVIQPGTQLTIEVQ